MRSILPAIFFFIYIPFCNAYNATDTLAGNLHLKKAQDLITAKLYDSALRHASSAYRAYRKEQYKKGMGRALLQSGTAAYFLKKKNESLNYLKEALNVLSPVASKKELYDLAIYNKIGVLNLDLGYYNEARKHFESAYALCKAYSSEDSLNTALVHYNLGVTYSYFGDIFSSLDHYLKALPVYIRTYGATGARIAHIYNNIGINHSRLGDYDYAKEFYRKAISIHIKNEGRLYWNLVVPYQGLATVFSHTGEKDSLHYYYDKILLLCKLHKAEWPQLNRREANAYSGLAIFYQKEGEYEPSLRYARQAVEILTKHYRESHSDLNSIYLTIANIYKDLGDYESALTSINKLTHNVIEEFGTHHPHLAEAKKLEAEIYLDQQQYEKALARIDDAIKSLTPPVDNNNSSVWNPKVYLSLIAEKAHIYSMRSKQSTQSTEDLTQALHQYIEAVQTIDKIRRGYLSEDSKLFLQSNSVEIYEKGISTCFDLYAKTNSEEYLDWAFFFMEKSKASILSEAIQSYNLKTINGIPQSVIQKEEELFNSIRASELALTNSGKKEPHLTDSLSYAIIDTRISLDSLSTLIKLHYPNYYNLKYNTEVVSLSTIQNELNKTTTALSYFEGDSAWFVCAISGEKVSLKRIGKEIVTSDLIRKYVRLLRDPESNISEIVELSAPIYEHLILAPLQGHSRTASLLVLTDGPLGYLPFEAIATSTGEINSRPRYLIEDFILSYATSMTLYRSERFVKSSYKQNYIGFAPSYSSSTLQQLSDLYQNPIGELKGAIEEVQFASEVFSGRAFLSGEATEFNFKRIKSPSRIIHLAMHAWVDDINPMNSKFLFATDSIDDGYLNAYELYNLPLQSQLAVLGACNTGYGKIKRGEGILSLSRAFMYAGCPNVVMNLWSARDVPTSKITRAFLINLKGGLPKEEALREAKLDYLTEGDPLETHPANWASMIFIGNAERFKVEDNRGFYTILVVMSGLLVLFFLLGRKHIAKTYYK